MMDTKILVVDDDPNISDLLKIYFENEGYEVKTVADGAEGINYFKMYEPDLVLLDIMLPKRTAGRSAVRSVRSLPSPSLWSPPRARSLTRFWDWSWALTISWSSPLI